MNKIKIAFVCNWGETSEQLLKKYSRQTPNNSGVWNTLEGIGDPSKSDYIIVLQSNGPPIDIPDSLKDKVILFRREPDFVQPWIPINGVKEVFDYSTEEKYHISTWWINLSYDELITLPYNKSKSASIISSNKWNHRTNYIKAICEMNPNTFDYYGNIQISNQSNFGYVPKKETSVLEYEKSVAIENSSQNNYFTEKILDCILCSTMPLYWGCPNISEYFPEGSYRLIDIQDPHQIKELLEEPISKKEIKSLKQAKDLILNKYNIWPVIQKILK